MSFLDHIMKINLDLIMLVPGVFTSARDWSPEIVENHVIFAQFLLFTTSYFEKI